MGVIELGGKGRFESWNSVESMEDVEERQFASRFAFLRVFRPLSWAFVIQRVPPRPSLVLN